MCSPKTKRQYGSMVVSLIDRWKMEMKMGFVMMLKKNLTSIISRFIAKKWQTRSPTNCTIVTNFGESPSTIRCLSGSSFPALPWSWAKLWLQLKERLSRLLPWRVVLLKTPFWDADRPKSGVLIQDWQSILSKGVEVEPNQGSQSIGIIWNSWSTFSWSSQLPYFIAPRAISVCIIFCIIFSSNASPDWGQRRAFCTQQLHLYICWEYKWTSQVWKCVIHSAYGPIMPWSLYEWSCCIFWFLQQ